MTRYPIDQAVTPQANRQIGELLGIGFLPEELHFIYAEDGVTELVASDRDGDVAFLRRSKLPLHVAKTVAEHCGIPLSVDNEGVDDAAL